MTTPKPAAKPVSKPGQKSKAAAAGDLLAVAAASGEFSIFIDLVARAGLTNTLQGAGPYTLFAPTDDAFEKLPAATLTKLRAPARKTALRAMTAYHFALGEVHTKRFLGKRIRAKSMQGGDLSITGIEGVAVNGASFVLPDIQAANGVLHGVDTVLWPLGAELNPAPAVS